MECETFIEGLSKSQPYLFRDIAKENVCDNLPANVKKEKYLIWIYKSLRDHHLSKILFWLLSDSKLVCHCYNENAFLRQEKYAKAAILCLKAVEQKQPSLLTEIDPSLVSMHKS